ncbi:hypothetical protein [Neobacillus sp. LXY-1]|uniref:hypothetical protein n=1 Tax=Neobacillus sp. LXY-1 TaxID=3379133 RepID=UPI003EDEB2BD
MFFLPTRLTIGEMKVGSPDHKSGIFFGENFFKGTNVGGKKNQGFGQQFGDCSITGFPINIVYDDEFIDAPVIKINKNL